MTDVIFGIGPKTAEFNCTAIGFKKLSGKKNSKGGASCWIFVVTGRVVFEGSEVEGVAKHAGVE